MPVFINKIEEESRIDALTGLFNRHYFNERLDEEIKHWQRHGRIFSLVICDLDYFRDYNNKYGHVAGDKLLREIGEVIKGSVREIDLAFRYGGDEFAILLPGTDLNEAITVAKRVQRSLEEEMKKRKILLTASFGLASYPFNGIESTDILKVADAAAYEAKRLGGNRCISSRMLESSLEDTTPQVETEEAIISIVCSLATALESRDIYTYNHSREVNKYALMLGEAIGLSKERLIQLSRAALLHDIGKIGISNGVLAKKERLSKKDWGEIKRHPKISANILGHIPALLYYKPAILHHHERWDGKGYPSGIKGKKIPLEARIVAIADAFAAMISDRPYRPAMSYQDALSGVKKEAGKQFDPELVETFVTVVEKMMAEKTG